MRRVDWKTLGKWFFAILKRLNQNPGNPPLQNERCSPMANRQRLLNSDEPGMAVALFKTLIEPEIREMANLWITAKTAEY